MALGSSPRTTSPRYYRRIVRVVVFMCLVFLMVVPAALASPQTLKLGQSRTFQKGQLTPGQKLVCIGNGKTITARVPQPQQASNHPSLTFGTTWVRGLSIEIDSTAQGTYFVSCH
jgi:hypothetical protein